VEPSVCLSFPWVVSTFLTKPHSSKRVPWSSLCCLLQLLRLLSCWRRHAYLLCIFISCLGRRGFLTIFSPLVSGECPSWYTHEDWMRFSSTYCSLSMFLILFLQISLPKKATRERLTLGAFLTCVWRGSSPRWNSWMKWMFGGSLT
jgi:hypothetical protein